MKTKVLSIIALIIFVIQILLILVSWIVTAANPNLPIHSLLGNEGLRWLFGHFIYNMASPLLVWLVVLGIAYGAMNSSGLYKALLYSRKLSLRHRFAIRLVAIEFVFVVITVFLLTIVPDAILLSATGHLFPSDFSNSLIPIIAFSLCVFSITYALMSGKIRSLTEIFNMLSCGIKKIAPLFILYIFVIELYSSIRFVFGI